MRHELMAVVAIAHRDLLKLLRDRGRMLFTILGPLVLVLVLGGTLQANLGRAAGFNFVGFTFTGILGMTLFQSTAQGITSLIEDRQTDFAKEMFVAPISRYTIICGKILGETLAACFQALGIVAFGIVAGLRLDAVQGFGLAAACIAICFVGGAFGVAALSVMNTERAARAIFPFVMFPQFFVAGIFSPVRVLPLPLDIASHISPLRYAVDLTRNAFYAGRPDHDAVVLAPLAVNMAVMAAMFAVFLVAGTWVFVRNERNR